MDHVRWTSHPVLRRPVVLAAFEGWNDAGDAASTAARWLRDRWELRPFAQIDPEEFFDFSETRPQVRVEDGRRVVQWPVTEASAGTGAGRDLVVILGTEPQLRWRTFCGEIVDIARAVDAEVVLTIGALLAEVPHTRPTSVLATSEDPAVRDRFAIERSDYEGPTGVVGVLHDALGAAGVPSASLWATVSAYVPGAPSPKAALALIERVTGLLDIPVIATDLEIASASYERQVSDVVADDEEMTEYLQRLEERYDEGDAVASPTALVEEVERFLRDNS